MFTEVSRRKFLGIVSGSVPAIAFAHQFPLLASVDLGVKASELVVIHRENSGYLVDPDRYENDTWPTRHEYFELENASDEEIHKKLSDGWEVDDVVEDPENWSVEEVRDWLDEYVDPYEINPYEAAKLSGYGPGIDLYEFFEPEEASSLGLCLVESPHPGSNFIGVHCSGDIENINHTLQRRGLNLRIVEAA